MSGEYHGTCSLRGVWMFQSVKVDSVGCRMYGCVDEWRVS